MSKLLLILCFMFPLMAQDIDEEKRQQHKDKMEVRENRKADWLDNQRHSESQKMIMQMKTHDMKNMKNEQWKRFETAHKRMHMKHQKPFLKQRQPRWKRALVLISVAGISYHIGSESYEHNRKDKIIRKTWTRNNWRD